MKYHLRHPDVHCLGRLVGRGLPLQIENCKSKIENRKGFTLPEMLVSISIVTIIAAITLPLFYALHDGYNSSGADSIISAALSSAKAMAAKEQKYVGIRFQCVPNPDDTGTPGDQYLVFIIQDPSLGSANGFRAAKGVTPIKLPPNQGVMDLKVKTSYTTSPKDKDIAADADISTTEQLWDTTTFTIVFSPSGRLVAHDDVQVMNKDGKAVTDDSSTDIVFNTCVNVNGAIAGKTSAVPATTYVGLLYEDNTTVLDPPATPGIKPFRPEESRKSLLIYDKRELARAFKSGKAYSGCLSSLSSGEASQLVFINPYTGTIIENQNFRNTLK